MKYICKEFSKNKYIPPLKFYFLKYPLNLFALYQRGIPDL